MEDNIHNNMADNRAHIQGNKHIGLLELIPPLQL
jgi:hypothetical protein